MEALKARLASGNAHKLEELRAALPGWELSLLETDRDYPPEDGETYEDNARGKALFARAHAPDGEWVLGEDSGIEVEALGGAPGIASARWAADGVARLLDELAGADDRRARYVCAIVAARPRRARRSPCGGRWRERPPSSGEARGLRLRPDLRPAGRAADGGGARRRMEAQPLPSRPRRGRAPRRPVRSGPVRGLTPARSDQARPAISSSSRRPYHQLTSAPRTITFAIT